MQATGTKRKEVSPMTEKRPNHRPPKERTIAADLDKPFYTIYEVSDLLQLHHNTVRTMIRKKELPAVQVRRQWRIKKTDLEAYTDTSTKTIDE